MLFRTGFSLVLVGFVRFRCLLEQVLVWFWLLLVGFDRFWLVLWFWLVLVGFGWFCILVPALSNTFWDTMGVA